MNRRRRRIRERAFLRKHHRRIERRFATFAEFRAWFYGEERPQPTIYRPIGPRQVAWVKNIEAAMPDLILNENGLYELGYGRP